MAARKKPLDPHQVARFEAYEAALRRRRSVWDPRYLIDATPERLAREAEYGRELMAQALKPPARTAKPAGTR